MSMSQEPSNSIEQVTRTTQIIMSALVAGVTFFLLIVVFLVHFVGFGASAGAAAAPGPNPPGAARPANEPAADQQSSRAIPLLTYIAAGTGAILLPLSFFLPGFVATQSLRSGAVRSPDGGSSPTKNTAPTPGAAGGPAAAFQTSAIIGGALNEGAAFLAGIAYLVEQNPIALAVAVVLLAALVMRFPTRNRVDRWIAHQEGKLRWGSSG